jgi:hypothetical protein
VTGLGQTGLGGKGGVTSSLHTGADKPWSEINPQGYGGPNGPAGSGGTGGYGGYGGYGGSYGPGPGGYTGSPSEQLQQSQNAANAANEARYGHGLSIYDQMLGMTGGMGTAQREMIRRGSEEGKAGDLQGMISSGIANTTVRQQHERARDLDANLARNELQDRLTQQRLGILSGKAGFIERRTDAQPDLGLISGLIEGASADPLGGTGTGGYGGTGGGSAGATRRLRQPTGYGFAGGSSPPATAEAQQAWFLKRGFGGSLINIGGQKQFIPGGGVSVKNPAAQSKPWDWAGQYGDQQGQQLTPLETQIQDEIRRRQQEAARKQYETQQKAKQEQEAQDQADKAEDDKQEAMAEQQRLGQLLTKAQQEVARLESLNPNTLTQGQYTGSQTALREEEARVARLEKMIKDLG